MPRPHPLIEMEAVDAGADTSDEETRTQTSTRYEWSSVIVGHGERERYGSDDEHAIYGTGRTIVGEARKVSAETQSDITEHFQIPRHSPTREHSDSRRIRREEQTGKEDTSRQKRRQPGDGFEVKESFAKKSDIRTTVDSSSDMTLEVVFNHHKYGHG